MAVKYQPLISDTPDLPPNRNAVAPCSMPFDELLQQAVQHTMVDFIRKGDWLKLEYASKVNVDAAWLREMHSRVDMDAVMQIVKTQVEQKIADGILNAMQQEIANDIKSIMCNRELREDIRSVIREKIRQVEKVVKDQ
jgi:hypothetical protein